MRIRRLIIRNFRTFKVLDVMFNPTTTCIIGENNTGKSTLMHAVRMCIDANLSSTYRSLQRNDIHRQVDVSSPSQVLIGLEIDDFAGKPNEEGLVGAWQTAAGIARLVYRFRPRRAVRDDIEAGDRLPGTLTLDDYHWEIVGGGDPADDLLKLDWNEDTGTSVRFADLQSFLVVNLPALRDVENDLRQPRMSPLGRLIEASDIKPAEQEALLQALRDANTSISDSPTIKAVATAIDKAFTEVAGPAFDMDVDLGLAEPTFSAVVRALRILLSNQAMSSFEPSSNGLGLNNILYISILIEWFRKRIAQQKSAGQIILVEEPEAHLHPQLQIALFNALDALPFQTLLTTHSTHLTAQAGLNRYVVLTHGGKSPVGSVPASAGNLEPTEISDLERYLDATKSNLLFARKVILVEGPAELFLIPALLKAVKGIDLDREGISVVPIYGVHFDVYAKLFTAKGLPKKCAIIADGDLTPSDATGEEGDDPLPAPPDLAALESKYVKCFANQTTFERAITFAGNLDMLAAAAADIGAPKVAAKLRKGAKALANTKLSADEQSEILNPLRASVLSTAKRFGKARFAQIAARHAEKASTLPKYLVEAVEWLRQ